MIAPRGLWVLALALLTACAGPTVPVVGGDAPPLIDRPGVGTQPDPVPRAEPRSASGNRSPYMVWGKTYHVLATARDYDEEGVASWYGRKFHGRPTASGETYDMFALTAAHKSLPLPTWVRVTNLENGRSAVLRVNDRGPFHGDRLIDLSYGAARKLGVVDNGTARVRVQAIDPGGAPPPVVAQPSEPEPETLAEAVGAIWLQAGAFGSRSAAEALRLALEDIVDDAGVELVAGDDGIVRVRIGPLATLQQANSLQALITFSDVVGTPLIVRE